MMSAQHTLLHLSLIEGVGPAAIAQLIERKPAHIAWHDLYTINAHELSTLGGFSYTKAELMVQGLADTSLLARELALLAKHQDISWCTVLDEHYPRMLKRIHAPPAVLYWQGDLSVCHEQAIAIVGSRDANSYGERVIKQFVPELVAHGCTIISGGAVGADSFAHQETINAGGVTVAVLGSGLLRPYPLSNQQLFRAIVECGGALMSCFPLTMQALPGNFPARNRIISGLSKGCLVIQAAQKSGALITAHYALEQGREVFAVPGDIDDPLSAGCHDLLRQGAIIVANIADVLRECSFDQVQTVLRPQKNVIKVTERETVQIPSANQGPEERVITLCKTPQSLDEIMAVLDIDRSELLGHLFDLQVKGLVKQDFAGMWHYSGR